MSVCKLSSVFAGACMLALIDSACAVTVDVYPRMTAAESIDLEIRAGDRVLCSVRKAADVAIDDKLPICHFELPAQNRALQVRGNYSWLDWESKKRRSAKGTHAIKLIDFVAAGSQLSAPGKSYGERIAAFITATNRFAHEQLPDRDYDSIGAGKPATQAAIDAAEKRLGFALPADFVSLQKVVGTFEIGDHRLNGIDEMDNAYHQIVHVWGTPEEAMQSAYSENMLAMLKVSTLLFTEVGDGIGGLIYRPGKTKSCGSVPTYYWTSQEGGTERLVNPDGSCMDFAAAFRWVLDEFVMSALADSINDEATIQTLMVDSSTGPQRVVLSLDTDDAFQVDLEVQWHGPHP